MGRDKFYEELGLTATPTLNEIQNTPVQVIEPPKSPEKPIVELPEAKDTPPTPPPVETDEVTDTEKEGVSGEEINELNARIKALEEWKAAKLAEEEATRTAKQQVAEDTTSKEEEKKEKKPSPLFLDFFGTFSPKE